MKLIGISQIDIKELERFVLSFNEVTLFQHPSFRNVIEKTKNYEWYWVGVEHDGTIIGSLAAYDIIDTVAGGMISTRRRMVLGGPLIRVHDEKIRNECMAMLLDGIRRIGKKPYFIEFRNLFDMSNYDKIFKSKGYKFEEHLNFIIDVTVGEEELLKRLSSDGRRMVKRALNKGLIVSEVTNLSEIDTFYNILLRTYACKGLPIPDKSLFISCFTELKDNERRFLVAKNEQEQIVAGRLLLIAGPNMYDWYAAADSKFLDRRPNELLVWSALRLAIRLGLKTFDFGGAGRPDEKYGVREFKKKFGGRLVNFGRYNLMVKPVRTAIAKKGMKIIAKMKNRRLMRDCCEPV